LVLDQGFSIKEVCEQFDLQDGALRRWVNQLKFERNGGVPDAAALTPEQQEIQALKAKINSAPVEVNVHHFDCDRLTG
jgi:transposase